MKRVVSDETRAKMRVAQKVRWDGIRANEDRYWERFHEAMNRFHDEKLAEKVAMGNILDDQGEIVGYR